MEIPFTKDLWRFKFALGGLPCWLACESWGPFSVPGQPRLRHYAVILSIAGGNALMLSLLFGGFLLVWRNQIAHSQIDLFNLLGRGLMANAVASAVVFDLLFYGFTGPTRAGGPLAVSPSASSGFSEVSETSGVSHSNGA